MRTGSHGTASTDKERPCGVGSPYPIDSDSRRCDDRPEMSLGWRREERYDIRHHPRRAHLGRDPVEHCGAVARDDQDEVVRRRLDDMQCAKAFDSAGLRYDLPLGAGEQGWIRRFSEMKVIDDGGRHTVTLTGVEGSPRWPRSDDVGAGCPARAHAARENGACRCPAGRRGGNRPRSCSSPPSCPSPRSSRHPIPRLLSLRMARAGQPTRCHHPRRDEYRRRDQENGRRMCPHGLPRPRRPSLPRSHSPVAPFPRMPPCHPRRRRGTRPPSSPLCRK